MRARIIAATLLAAAAGPVTATPPDPAGLPRARNPNIAVQEELAAARRAGTVAAYDLFLARHGDHPLAETARRERAALLRRRRRD